MAFRFPNRLLRLFSVAIADQVLLSAANFFVGFLLIRHSTDADYGLYVLTQSAMSLFVSAQAAWVSGPIAVLAPKRTPEKRYLMIGSIDLSQRKFLAGATLLSMLVPVAGYIVGVWSGLIALVSSAGVLAIWVGLQREFLRTVFFTYSRPKDVLRIDLIYTGILLPGALAAAFVLKPASLWAVLALAVSAWGASNLGRRMLAANPGWQTEDAGPYWKEMRSLGVWSAAGALIYWLFSQSYNYVLAGRIGLSAVASVNAARLLLMPTIVLTVGVKGLLNPMAASWLHEAGVRSVLRRLALIVAIIGVLDVFYFVFVWVFRDWLTVDFLHKDIGDRDALLMLWACVSLVSLIRDVFQSALMALEKFKPMAWLTAAAAVVCLSLMSLEIGQWGAKAALIGQMAGESINLVGVFVLLWQAVRSSKD